MMLRCSVMYLSGLPDLFLILSPLYHGKIGEVHSRHFRFRAYHPAL